jgi:TonB family protein
LPAREPAPRPAKAASETPRTPIAVPKIVVPGAVPTPEPTAPPKGRTDLRERLERRLAALAPGESSPAPAAEPRIAALPAIAAGEPPRVRPVASPAADVRALPPGPVVALADFPYAWYLAVLKEKVYAEWSPPSEFYLGRRSAQALVGFRIDRTGRTSNVQLKEGSGYGRFDQSALAAVLGLRSVPVLPPHYPEDTLDVVIRFQNE